MLGSENFAGRVPAHRLLMLLIWGLAIVLALAAIPSLYNHAVINFAALEVVRALVEPELARSAAYGGSALTLLEQISPAQRRGWDERMKGLAHFARGEYEAAVAALQRAVDQQPERATLFDLGRAYWASGDQEGAYQTWRRADAAAYFIRRGDRGQTAAERTEFYELAVNTAPDSAEAHYIFADFLYYSTAEREKAISLYRRAIVADPKETARKYAAAGRIARHEFDMPRAQRNYEAAISLGDHSVNTYLEYGDTLRDLGSEVALVESAYYAAHESEPLNRWPYLRMTSLYLVQGDEQQLLAWYQSTIPELVAQFADEGGAVVALLADLSRANAEAGACQVHTYLVEVAQSLQPATATPAGVLVATEDTTGSACGHN